MRRFARKLLVAAVFGAGIAGMSVAADEKKPDETPAAPMKVDWSKYAAAGDVVGKVTKSDTNGFTLQLTKTTPAAPVRGTTRGRRPQMQQPKVTHQDYNLTFAENGSVRLKNLPPKVDENGKKASYTSKELADLKSPPGAPGYAGDATALRAGAIVEVVMVRDKAIPADKATLGDMKVKYAIVIGYDNNPNQK